MNPWTTTVRGMAYLVREGETLVLWLTPQEKVQASHGEIRVPLSSVTSVEVLENPIKSVHGLRIGAGVPGSMLVGTVIGWHTKTFAVIHADTRRGVRVKLNGAKFDQLVLGCDDPETMINSLAMPS
jgi:hypothetical protein